MDIMIDIETLGTGPHAPVISIGAVAFDLTEIKEGFYISLDLTDQIDSGKRKVDASTIKWWLSQNDAAKKVFKEDPKMVQTALAALAAFVKKFDDVYVWGNGPSFDMTILETLYTDYQMSIPWRFNKIMDFRTIKRFLGKDIKHPRNGTHHNALDDACYQAEFVQKCLRKQYGVSIDEGITQEITTSTNEINFPGSSKD